MLPQEAKRVNSSSLKEDNWIPSACFMCYNACGILAHRVDGVVVKIEGDPKNPNSLGKLCPKGNAGLMSLYNANRILKPLKRTNPDKQRGGNAGWKEISWGEAIAEIAERLKKVKADDPRKLIFATFDYPGSNFLGAWLTAYGSPNFTYQGASYYCGNAFHPPTYLYHASFFAEPDLKYCKYLILIGTQQGHVVNHLCMRMGVEMADARMRGMKLVVVDPVCNHAASKADEWVPIKPGTDAAFALSIIHVLINELHHYDRAFLAAKTNAPYLVQPDGHYMRDHAGKPLIWDTHAKEAKPFNAVDPQNSALEGEYAVGKVHCKPAFELLKAHVAAYPPERASEITTVPAETIRRIAGELVENAQIGSTIKIEDVELPYRPACVNWYRGPSAHLHGLMAGYAIGLVNVILGACDVPGGHIAATPIGPWWRFKESAEGLLVANDDTIAHICDLPYPARKVTKPESLFSFELFPVAVYSDPMMIEAIKDPKHYGLYAPEILMIAKTNPLGSLSNSDEIFDILKKVSFTVLFTTEPNELMDLADIVLPDTHYLERLDGIPAAPYMFQHAGEGDWYWHIRQPIVQPMGEARYWVEVMIELAYRIGLTPDFNQLLNFQIQLKDPYKLDSNSRYSYEDMCDRFLKSKFGEEFGLEHFYKAGTHIYGKRSVNEAYPRMIMPRIPIYQEHLIDAGHEIQRVTKDMGVAWDTSDYKPIPSWAPCEAYNPQGEYDLIAVNYKIPYQTLSRTIGNPWLHGLKEMKPHHLGFLINKKTAARKGVRSGDKVTLESTYGFKIQGFAFASELVHPEVIAIAGNFRRNYELQNIRSTENLRWNDLLPHRFERIDKLGASLDACIRVKVTKG